MPHRILLLLGSGRTALSALYLTVLVLDYAIRGPELGSALTLVTGIIVCSWMPFS